MAEGQVSGDVPPAKKRKKVSRNVRDEEIEKPKPKFQNEERTCDHEEPLLFFFYVKTTGLNIYEEHIIQLAAKVIGVGKQLSYIKVPIFSELIYTSHPIHPLVSDHDINADMLCEKKPFQEIFPKFLCWMRQTNKEVSKHTGVQHYPVLATHNGFSHGICFLLAEIERNSEHLTTSQLITENIFFSDTLQYLREVKQEHDALKTLKKFALEDLYAHFTKKYYQGHRAPLCVEAMEEIFSHKSLAGLLPSVPKRSAEEQLQKWNEQKKKRAIRVNLKEHLGHKIKDHQVNRLADLDLCYSELCDIRTRCTDDQEFQEELRKRKVNSKDLRQFLTTTIPKTI